MSSHGKTVLATAFFDGQAARKPVQSFSTQNSSPGDSREAFLRQLHEDRQKRELDRRRTQAAVKIQKFWRRRKFGIQVKSNLREVFDECVRQETFSQRKLQDQIRRLVLFFKSEIDGGRLIWLCQNFIKSVGAGDRYSTALTSLLLTRCLRYLKHAAPKGQNISITMPFRSLEVSLLEDRPGGFSVIEKLQLFGGLIDRGYFETLRDLLDHRTPSSDLCSESPKAPTFQAESFMKAVTGPLGLYKRAINEIPGQEANVKPMMYKAWRAVILSFLSKAPMTPIVRYYVLPCLAKADDIIPLDALARVISDHSVLPTIEPFPQCKTAEFAYSLAFIATKMGLNSAGSSFVVVYSKVCGSLLDLIPQQTAPSSDEDSGGLSDEPNQMETDQRGAGRDWLIKEWLKLNHDETMVSHLSRLLDVATGAYNEEILLAVMELCRIHWTAEHFITQHCGFLQMLTYQPKLIRRLWQAIVNCTTPSIMGPPRPLIGQLQKGQILTSADSRRLVPMLSVFCALFSTTLMAANDEDFFDDLNLKPRTSGVPFSRLTLACVSSTLRDVALGLIELALPDSRPTVSEEYREALTNMGIDFSKQDTTEWNKLFEAVVRLVQLLHDRDERLQFCPIGYWSVRGRVAFQHIRLFRSDNRGYRRRRLFNVPQYLTRQQLEEDKSSMLSAAELRDMTILRKIPFVVPFEKRVELLYLLVENDKREHGRAGVWQAGHNVAARRNFLYEDGFSQLSKESVPDLRQLIRVRLQNWAGAVEAGVDGGGLFREFLNELLKSGFDPQRGFFISTAHDSTLYPNPLAPVLFRDDEYRRHYFFLGRLVGKLIYENQLAELRFSRFFLATLLRPTTDVDVHQMSYYDPVLYKNLLRLKNEEDVSLLDLDFSVLVEELGENLVLDLVPNGRDIPVTNANRLEYIQRVAEFYLYRRIKGQSDAFRAGISDLIDLDWLQMFDYRELQVLISGADREIDIEDLRRNTRYTGDVKMEEGQPADAFIDLFWSVLRGFDEEHKRKLLKFVTSCSRPPILGFSDLHPPFSIQVYQSRGGEQDRLPTAATCIHLLKLPRFQDENTLRNKLVYAIDAGIGFELS